MDGASRVSTGYRRHPCLWSGAVKSEYLKKSFPRSIVNAHTVIYLGPTMDHPRGWIRHRRIWIFYDWRYCSDASYGLLSRSKWASKPLTLQFIPEWANKLIYSLRFLAMPSLASSSSATVFPFSSCSCIFRGLVRWGSEYLHLHSDDFFDHDNNANRSTDLGQMGSRAHSGRVHAVALRQPLHRSL